MKKGKIITASLIAAGTAAGIGYGLYSKKSNNGIGEFVINGIPARDDNALRIMSFNLRYRDDKGQSVKKRSEVVSAIIKQYAPDSFGTQEATGKWLDILGDTLGDKYAFVATARDTKGYDAERNAVFYLKDKYNLIDKGTIWLSETPDVPYSKSFDSNCHRIATWAVLENKETGEKYTHLNTHLDHILESTRVAQARVLISKLNELQAQGKVICTGDFNADFTSDVYSEMMKITDDAKEIAQSSDCGITYHEYGKVSPDEYQGAIDHIFVPKQSKVSAYKVIRNTFNGIYASDHYPVVADISD